MRQFKFLFLLSLAFLMLSSAGKNPLPKRLISNYSGTQEAYEINVNDNPVNVPAVQLTVKLSYNELILSSPSKVLKARYEISSPTKKYYALKVYFEDGSIENWQLYRKGKKILRDGLHPRPSMVFVKR